MNNFKKANEAGQAEIVYYTLNYDRRMGGDFIEYYDAELNCVGRESVFMDSFGRPLLNATKLPAAEGLQMIAKRSSIAKDLHEVEPVEGSTEWVKVGEIIRMRPDQIENINENLGIVRKKPSIKTLAKYVTRDREAGNIIDYFKTREEAEQALASYEASDKAEGIYEPDFYEVAENPKRSEALAAAQSRYDAKQRKVMIRLDTIQDADLIAHIEAQPSMQAYIKRLIREDIER